MRQFLLCSAVVVAMAACPVLAGAEVVSVAVTGYYSWSQLPMSDVTSSVGSATDIVGSRAGSPGDIRFGAQWIPNRAMTGNPVGGAGSGTNAEQMGGSGTDFWAIIELDQARWVDVVGVQWNTGNMSSISKYSIQALTGYTDEGEEIWTLVGESPEGMFYLNGQRAGWYRGGNAVTLDKPGEYQAIRIYVEEGDYTCGRAGGEQGGPGIIAIDLMAANRTIEIEVSQVNWASKAFGAAATASPTLATLGRKGVGNLNTGYFHDDENPAWVTGVYGETSYITTDDDNVRKWHKDIWIDFNLGETRYIDEVVGIWCTYNASGGAGFLVQYSLDNATWLDVTDGEVTQYAGNGATSVTFDGVEAQYWRISEAVFVSGDNCGFTQILMYGNPIPEPATMSLLALGGLALLRRRK